MVDVSAKEKKEIRSLEWEWSNAILNRVVMRDLTSTLTFEQRLREMSECIIRGKAVSGRGIANAQPGVECVWNILGTGRRLVCLELRQQKVLGVERRKEMSHGWVQGYIYFLLQDGKLIRISEQESNMFTYSYRKSFLTVVLKINL